MAGNYYKDPDYGNWVAIFGGKTPYREFFDTEEQAKTFVANYSENDDPDFTIYRVNPPPDSNREWYIGDGQQWRKEPVRKQKWDREGVHAGLGLLLGILPFVANQWVSELTIIALVASVMTLVLFISYEITEGWRVRDWGYRDIGGAAIGYFVATCVGLAAAILA